MNASKIQIVPPTGRSLHTSADTRTNILHKNTQQIALIKYYHYRIRRALSGHQFKEKIIENRLKPQAHRLWKISILYTFHRAMKYAHSTTL